VLMWRAYNDDMLKLQDAHNDGYATASMISADTTCVSCTKYFNSNVECCTIALTGMSRSC
jgi:hypothetical protein